MLRLSGLVGLALATGLTAGCATRGGDLPPADGCAQPPVLSARGSARPIPGFAGLATQRFLGGVLAESSPEWTATQWQSWLARSRALALHDGTANAGLPVVDGCVSAWAASLASSGGDTLRRAATVSTEYSLLQRALGVYPLTGVGLRLGISGYQRETRESWEAFQLPAEEATEFRPYALAAVPVDRPAQTAQRLRQLSRDALGFPNLDADLAASLATDFAPRFLVQTRGEFDLPGAPQLQPALGVDVTRPVLSWRLDFTLVHGVVLPQISWIMWFAERPPESDWDPYSGALDGVVWRTTFGPDGWPLVYDTIHPCGCFHMVFPTRHAGLDPQAGFWEEERVQPQAPASWAQVLVVVDTATHFVRAIAPADSGWRVAQELTLEPWAQTRKSIEAAIDPQGVIAGSERLERYWLWPSGVRSPGAMRDWGRHATAFIGQQHFDDLRVLEPYIAPAVVQQR